MKVFKATLDRFTKDGVDGWRWLVSLSGIVHTGWAPKLSEAVEDVKNVITTFVPEAQEVIHLDLTIAGWGDE